MSDFSNDSDLEMEEDSKLDLEFTKATEHLQQIHTEQTPNDLLELYALYKQATVGPCNTAKPTIFQMQGRAKWCAWHDLGTMEMAEAKCQYVTKLAQLDPNFEVIKKSTTAVKSTHNWVVHSIQLPPEEEDPPLAEHEKTTFDFVKECKLENVRTSLSVDELQRLDANGMGLLHWATDRNSPDILEFLLQQGANVNLQDAEGQTALHYAACCANLDCIYVLLKFGADRTLRDADGQSCIDVADDEKVKQILEH